MVRTVVRAVITTMAGIAIACAPQSAPAKATPSPSAMLHSEPAQLIVHLSDMPAGYGLEGDQAMTLESMSGGDDRAIVREQALRAGFLAGQARLFSLDADAPTGDRTSAVYLFVFKDQAAAAEALEMGTPKDPSVARAVIGVAVGDNAHGYRLRQTATDGSQRDALMIQFAYGNAVSYVIVQGIQSAPAMGEVTAIALKQVAALQADAVGPALTTPQPRTSPITKVSADLGLRVTDLPSGFSTDTSVALDPEDLSEDANDLTFWRDAGYRRGWGAVFTSADGAVTVTSVVTVLGGAKIADAFKSIVKTASEDVYEISLDTTVGDESVGLESHGADGSTRITARSIYFRFGDSVGWVNVQGPTGGIEATFVVDLAKALVSHLQ